MEPNRATMEEHQVLLDAADAAVAELSRFNGHMRRGDVEHMQHSEFALRAHQLALHLRSIRAIVMNAHYPSAFSLLRTALEHHLIDHLVLLGRRYVQVYDNVSDEQWEDLLAAYESGASPARTIAERPTRSNRGRVTVVREGLYARGDDPDASDYTVSPVYFILKEYSPFTGRPSDQEFLDDGLLDIDLRVEEAHRQRALWQQYLTWSSITESLELNGFYTGEQVRQMQVHYRFLSAFVHATEAAYESAFPRGIVAGPAPVYDHYSSELALLYLNAIAARELIALLEMTTRPPTVEVPARKELEGIAEHARLVSQHLWFPGDDPHEYDRVMEANRRVWRRYRNERDLPAARTDGVSPRALEPSEVTYYDNPLKRIVELHRSSTELTTGFTYTSPWERPDARFR